MITDLINLPFFQHENVALLPLICVGTSEIRSLGLKSEAAHFGLL